MPKAIRIDGTEVINAGAGEWHFDILQRWQHTNGLTDDQVDEAIASGRIEFGGSFWSPLRKELDFTTDKSRMNVYTSIDAIAEISNR